MAKIVNNQNHDIRLTPEDRIFVDNVQNRITAYGAIPYKIPERVIIDSIKDAARIFFRYGYYRAQEHKVFLLPIKELKNYANEKYRSEKLLGLYFQLPGYVNGVDEVWETNKSEAITAGDDSTSSSYNSMEMSYSNTYDSSANGQFMYGINQNLVMIESAVKMIESNVMKSVYGREIPFHFSPSTKQIIFYETNFSSNLVLPCTCNTDIQALYNDDLFIRYTMALVKTQLKRILATHTVSLPGDTTLNPDEICDNLDDKEKVEETLKQAGGIGDIILMN